MKTTAEASKMWCPMVRSRGENAFSHLASVNTYDEAYVTPTCYANGCMMWRWGQKPRTRYNKTIGWGTYTELPGCEDVARHEFDKSEAPPFPDLDGCEKEDTPWFDTYDWCWVQAYTRETDPTATGYCGLAGVPQ